MRDINKVDIDLTGHVFNDLTVLHRDKNDKTKWVCRCVCGNITTVSNHHLVSSHTKSCGCRLSRNKESMVGKKFGRLTVLRLDKDSPKLVCRCDCGNITKVYHTNLIKGLTKSCGCYQKEVVSKRLLEDLIGQKFGRLTVIELFKHPTDNKRTYWKCKCECGKEPIVRAGSLKAGNTKSCGCLKRELTSKNLSYKLEGKRFGRLIVLKRNGVIVGSDGTKYSAWLCKCDCGTVKTIKGADLVQGKVQSCGCLISKGEEEMRNHLNTLNINFSTQYSFSDLKSDKGWPLRFDFAILDDNSELLALIEYQGIQHFEENNFWGNQQRLITDKQKKEYCHKNSIPLFEITYLDDIEEKIHEVLSKINYYTLTPCQAPQGEGVTTIQ